MIIVAQAFVVSVELHPTIPQGSQLNYLDFVSQMANTITRFKEVFVKGQKDRGWRTGDDYNPMCGYVQLTSIPKHLGSVVWTLGWQVFIILAAIILIFADLAMAIPERNNIFWRLIKMVWLDGMTYTRAYGTANPYIANRDPTPFFLAPLAFFKIFISFGYLSQTFYGVDNGMNQWGEQTGPNTQEFCVYAGFILAGSSALGLMTGHVSIPSSIVGFRHISSSPHLHPVILTQWIYQGRHPRTISEEHGNWGPKSPPRGDWRPQTFKDVYY
ncbi:hypothetical protein QFC21_005336 [Naganishia friedmannii]|uniref:Uncharacterized protein n=1 Tax=Naganishia friedmannii TaxID=89922 RepID=A0ACC2V9X0_9TREE|nr:hypothetical protein QFC21_005336 [Naganishia friedmannii]